MKRFAFVVAACGMGLAVAPAARAEMRPFDAFSWQAIRAAHAGRPTLVHFWSMTCVPCRIEMPRLAAFLSRHSEMDVVTVDTDVKVEARADEFLASSGMPTGQTWHFADPFAEKLWFSVDPAWQGELPMTVMLDRKGAAEATVGATDDKVLEEWLARRGR